MHDYILAITPVVIIIISNILKISELPKDICVTISVVIIEEMIFRKLCMQKWLYQKTNLSANKAILISSLLFAIAHIANNNECTYQTIYQMICAFNFGICASVLLLKTEKIWIPIILHIIINITASNIVPFDIIPIMMMIPFEIITLKKCKCQK